MKAYMPSWLFIVIVCILEVIMGVVCIAFVHARKKQDCREQSHKRHRSG
jgi:hypothetical protein